jgi:membrane protein involved in colicin uptake
VIATERVLACHLDMHALQREESVLTSLNELRSIEQERVADERAARERSLAEAEAARLDAERKRADEVRAKIEAAEAESRQRADAEREAVRKQELAVALAEAEARAKAEAELASVRMAEEIQLRREQVQRTRPVLLFVVSGVLACAGVAAAWIAMQRGEEIAQIQQATHDAEQRTKAAQAKTEDLRRQTEALEATKAQVQKMLDDRERQLEILRNATPAPSPAPTHTSHPHTRPAAHPDQPTPHPQIVIPKECKDSALCEDQRHH